MDWSMNDRSVSVFFAVHSHEKTMNTYAQLLVCGMFCMWMSRRAFLYLCVMNVYVYAHSVPFVCNVFRHDISARTNIMLQRKRKTGGQCRQIKTCTMQMYMGDRTKKKVDVTINNVSNVFELPCQQQNHRWNMFFEFWWSLSDTTLLSLAGFRQPVCSKAEQCQRIVRKNSQYHMFSEIVNGKKRENTNVPANNTRYGAVECTE